MCYDACLAWVLLNSGAYMGNVLVGMCFCLVDATLPARCPRGKAMLM